MDKKGIAEALKKAMEVERISLNSLARKSNVSKPTISKMLTGLDNYEIGGLIKVAATLKIEILLQHEGR